MSWLVHVSAHGKQHIQKRILKMIWKENSAKAFEKQTYKSFPPIGICTFEGISRYNKAKSPVYIEVWSKKKGLSQFSREKQKHVHTV